MKTNEAQELLEAWWNEDPEMRWVEILCGDKLRVCVRLYEVSLPSLDPAEQESEHADSMFLMAEAEDGTLEEAIRAAVAKTRVAAA